MFVFAAAGITFIALWTKPIFIYRRIVIPALRFFRNAILLHGHPKKITLDGYHGNHATAAVFNDERRQLKLKPIEIRQCRYLNNIVEQDHRSVKRKLNASQGYKTHSACSATLCGIELAHMLRKHQIKPKYQGLTLAQQFELLAA